MQTNREQQVYLPIVASVAMLSLLACQPVIAIGWREGFFIFLVAAILLGPPVYRFFRKLEEHWRQKDK
jgi:hypothetical protein